MTRYFWLICWFLTASFLGILTISEAWANKTENKDLVVYSAQKEHLIRPLLNKFSAQNNVQVKLITGKEASLISRLEQEGNRSPADILLAADAGHLSRAEQKGLLQPIKSRILDKTIPDHLRNSKGSWYGFTIRARALFFRRDMPIDQRAQTYEDLASHHWNNMVLVRSSSNVYNQSLLASIIASSGEDAAFDWANYVSRNFARMPKGGDRDQLRALAAGEGGVAIANSYYYGQMLGGKDITDRRLASSLVIVFPNQRDRGTHINIRGGGVTAHASNKQAAIQLLEYLVSREAQEFLAYNNYEYPVIKDARIPDLMYEWGGFKEDKTSLELIGEYSTEATKIFDKVGWQ